MLYARGVRLAKDVAYLLIPPLSSQTEWSHPGKEESYEPKALIETMLPRSALILEV